MPSGGVCGSVPDPMLNLTQDGYAVMDLVRRRRFITQRQQAAGMGG